MRLPIFHLVVVATVLLLAISSSLPSAASVEETGTSRRARSKQQNQTPTNNSTEGNQEERVSLSFVKNLFGDGANALKKMTAEAKQARAAAKQARAAIKRADAEAKLLKQMQSDEGIGEIFKNAHKAWKKDIGKGKSDKDIPINESLKRVLDKAGGNEDYLWYDICHGFNEHWARIFGDPRVQTEANDSSIDVESQNILLDTIDRRLNSEVADELDEDLTAEEFAKAIKKLKSHSAPGPDGFTSDFFRLDPDLFGAILLEVFRYQAERGILLPHQRYSSVALLFKKGERSDPGNFRPITLMPVEVKILSRVLVNRLRPLMTKLVHPDQKGFIPGRRIDQQVMLVRDLQYLMTSQNHKGLATFLDFAKAYDRVNRQYLFRVLERQGFGARFLSWIKLMYTESECSILVFCRLPGW